MTKGEKELIKGIEALRTLLQSQELHLAALRQQLYQGKYARLRTDNREFVGYVASCTEETIMISTGQDVQNKTLINWDDLREIKSIEFPPDEVV